MFDTRYPYGGYTQAFVPDFNAGAMENPGCVTLRDQMLLKGTPTRRERADRASVIAHEMAHQWFGDLVTMRWWDDLWLNESFAEYLGHRVASEHTQYDVWTAFGVNRKAWGAAADEGPNTHPVAGNGADDAQGALANFDGISYAKGASVLRQMATAMGETIFRRGLNAYFAAHLFGNATSDDLFQAWTDAGAAGLDGVRQAWLGTAGMDLIRAENWGNLGRIQVTPPDSGATPRRHAIEIAGLRADGSAVDQGRAVVGVGETPLPGDVEDGLVLVPDVGDITWARLRPSSWALPPLSRIARASTRVVLVNAMADAVRGGELAVADALALLVDGLPGEPDDDIVAAGLNLAVSWAQIWSVPARRAERRDAVAHLAALMLDQAGPGSDRQVICARALARVSDDTGLLTAWWQGKRLPQGLVPDDALRWALVTRIVLLGGDTGLIGRQLASDDTDRGHDAAAAAWAGAPTLAAKRAALDTLLRPSDKRVYEVYAVAAALWPAEQCDLCAPLVGEYFDGLAATASFRQGWGLTRAAECGFPMAMASPAALARAMALLADPGLDERLRRTVAERADIMRRVLRAQALEAEG
jgi:aminopeptidase N